MGPRPPILEPQSLPTHPHTLADGHQGRGGAPEEREQHNDGVEERHGHGGTLPERTCGRAAVPSGALCEGLEQDTGTRGAPAAPGRRAGG